MAVVVSAFGGVTDLLLNASRLASEQDVSYKNSLKEIEDRHISAIRELIPVTSQSAALSKVKSELNILETLLEGAFLVGELTPKLSDKIVSYGELLSSFIISEFLKSEGLDVAFKDSRELYNIPLICFEFSLLLHQLTCEIFYRPTGHNNNDCTTRL